MRAIQRSHLVGQGRVRDPEGLGAYERLDMEDKDIPARKIQGITSWAQEY